ncbi:MAG TPA: Ig-like domain repeat protein [Candidatus Acidoferrales bacterium]|jgi:fibronectin-binding autotransporter adhesin|nr:Ig-like domain repeat protein [Candidatus Acidoferrales bacterium]
MKQLVSMPRRAACLLAMSLLGASLISTRADTITGTGWKGTAGNNNWSSTGNWDATAPNTSGTGDRNLFFGQGYKAAGGTGSTSPNNDLSGWHGYRITFQDSNAAGNGTDGSSANDTAFTLTGNAFTLFDFGGVFPRVENDSFLTQTFTLTGGQVLGFSGTGGGSKAEIDPVNGNIIVSAGTRIDLVGTTQLQIFGSNGKTLAFNEIISSSGNGGTNSLAIDGNSLVIFAATNTYGGDTFVNAGTLQCATNSAVTNNTFVRLGDTSGVLGANLNLNGGLGLAAKINVRSGSTGPKVIANTASTTGTATYSGNLFADADFTLFANTGGGVTLSGTTLDLKNQTLTVDGTGSSAISGVMTNSTGTGKLIKNGAGTLTISGANTNSGGITLNAGTLNLNSSSALGSTAGTLTITAGTIDNTTASAISMGNYPQAWNGDFTFTGTKDLTFGSGAVAMNASRQVTISGGTLTIGGIVSGSTFTLTKLGAGTLKLSTADTYGPASGTVGTTIKAGTITAGSATALGAGDVTLGDTTGVTGATLNISGGSSTLANNLSIASGSSGVKTIGAAGNSSYVYSGAISLSDNLTIDTSTGSGSVNVSGAITGNFGVTKVGTSTGAATLSKASSGNTYTGNTTISQGTLKLGSATAIPNGTGKGIVTLNPTSPDTATFDLAAQNQTINGLTSSGTGSSIVDNSSATAKTLTVGTAGSNPDGTFAGVIQNSGASTSLALTKAGSGKLTLTGKNTYGGATTVGGGTLLVNGGSTSDSSSGTGSGAVSVSSGATLGGTGRIGGNVTYNASALAVFTQGSPLAIGGTLTLNANVVHLNLPSNLGVGSYALATYTSSGSSGAFNSTPVVDSGSLASGTTASISTGGGNVTLIVQNTTSTALTRTAGANPSAYGDSLTFHAVVSPDPGDGSTITFRTNGVAIGTAVTASGAADLTTAALTCSGGSAYTVTADFGGNANDTASSGTLSGGQTVNALVVSLAGTRAYDGTTNAAAAILSVANKVGSDDVTVASGTGGLAGADIGTQAITSPGSLALGGIQAPNYTLTGAGGSVTITQASTTVAVSSSSNPSGYLDALTFTANVTPAAATGSVTFFNGATPFSTNSLVTGVATSASINMLPRGTNTITAIYAGDANCLAGTNTLAQIVTNHPPVAGNVSYNRGGVSTFKIKLSDLLLNVTDLDGDSNSVTGFGTSTNGVTLATNGGFAMYSNTNLVSDQFSYTVSDGFGGSATATITLATQASLTGQSESISVSGGVAMLEFSGIPGYGYNVQRTTDLINWTTIFTTNAPASGQINFTDDFHDLGSVPSAAFYQLQYQP